jgi:hypothetical protein
MIEALFTDRKAIYTPQTIQLLLASTNKARLKNNHLPDFFDIENYPRKTNTPKLIRLINEITPLNGILEF